MSSAAWAQDWLRTVDDRVAWLVAEGGAEGVVPPRGDGAGAVPLWAWAVPRFVRRPPGAVPGELPVWYGDPRAWTPRWWDDETIWLCDAVIAWFATELLSALPGAGLDRHGRRPPRRVALRGGDGMTRAVVAVGAVELRALWGSAAGGLPPAPERA